MKTPDQVRAIADREKRVVAATRLLAQAEAKRDTARSLRDMATIVAHLDDGVPPVDLYRDVLGVSRGLFNRIIQRAPADRPQIKSPVKTAAKAAADLRKYTDLVDEARTIRDETAIAMMNGVADDGSRCTPVSNAHVSRLTGLTTARIAQMRKGQ